MQSNAYYNRINNIYESYQKRTHILTYNKSLCYANVPYKLPPIWHIFFDQDVYWICHVVLVSSQPVSNILSDLINTFK